MKKKSRIVLLALLVLAAAGILALLNFYGTFYHDNIASG